MRKALISMHMMLQSSIVAHAHLLYLVRARDLTNQMTQNLLVFSSCLSRKTCEGKKLHVNTESTTFVTMTWAVSSYECNCYLTAGH